MIELYEAVLLNNVVSSLSKVAEPTNPFYVPPFSASLVRLCACARKYSHASKLVSLELSGCRVHSESCAVLLGLLLL